MYKVIKHFCDLQDKNYSYNEGDIFPREGLKVSEERLTELAGSKNKQGRPLIQLVVEDVEKLAEKAAEEAKTAADNASTTAEPAVAPAQLAMEAAEAVKEAADNAVKATKRGAKKAAK